MEPIDNKIKSELSRSPFKQQGFDDELRRAIELRLDEPINRSRRWSIPLASAAACAAVLAIFIWSPISDLWSGQPVDIAAEHLDAPQTASVSTPKPQEQAVTTPIILDSALLIGLRRDVEETQENDARSSFSEYRTFLIAPKDDRLQLIAQGEGLLVPYGQQFWQLDAPIHRTATDQYQTLSAYPAVSPMPSQNSITDDPEVSVQHTQKILYAGNRYISIEETERRSGPDGATAQNHVWVGLLEQFGSFRTLAPPDEPFEAHIPLQELLGDVGKQAVKIARALSSTSASDSINGKHWAILRDKTKWVAHVEQETSNPLDPYRLIPLPIQLPESVVSHDVLCCSWSDVLRVAPSATDALSSPTGDIIAITEGDQLLVHALLHGQIALEPLLAVQLAEDERLVMAQWATLPYIPSWIDAAEKFLGSPAATH